MLAASVSRFPTLICGSWLALATLATGNFAASQWTAAVRVANRRSVLKRIKCRALKAWISPGQNGAVGMEKAACRAEF